MPTRTIKTFASMSWRSIVEQYSGYNLTYSSTNGPSIWTYSLPGTITGVNNPGYKNQIQRRSNASTAYSRKEWLFVTPAKVDYEFESGVKTSNWSRCDGSQTNYGSLSASAILYNVQSGIADKALTRLKQRLASASGRVNAMPPLAEIGDLRRTIRGSVEITTKLLKTLIDLKRTRGRSGLKYASRAWLTWNFGISPMIRDTKNILESINSYMNRQDLSTRLSASASTNGQYKFDMGEAYENMAFPCIASYELSYRYVGAFDIFLKSANDYSLSNQLGLTPVAIIPAAWELLPFSWVADYFVNVGNFLDDTFTSPPGNLRYLCLDRRYRVRFQISVRNTLPRASRINRFTVKDGAAEYFEFERTPTTVLPHIGLRFKTVDEVGQFGLSKMMNLLSILGK